MSKAEGASLLKSKNIEFKVQMICRNFKITQEI